MDDGNSKLKASDPQEEVKKLQDLVRKLELQNEQLRSKQKQRNNNNNCASPTSNSTPNHHNHHRQKEEFDEEEEEEEEEGEEEGDSSQSSILDQVDLIDVEVLDLSDEDSWLYASPEKLTEEQKAVSPYKWLRSDVEDPHNREIQSVKRALVSKIEDLTRASLAHNNCLMPSPVVKLSNHVSQDESFEGRIRLPLNTRLSLSPGLQKEIDTRTFTRPKKSLRATELPIVDCDREIDRLKLSATPPPPPLPPLNDVTDIHTIARLQEECLRQSSPPSTPRRSSVASSSSQRSGMSPVTASDHDTFNNVMHTSAGTDSLHDGSPRAMSSRASSASASPPVSPHSSQYLEESRCSAYGAVGKRSLPNLPRPAYNGLYSQRGPRISQSPQRSHANSNCDVISRSDQALRNHRYSLSPARRSIGSGGSCTPRSSSPAPLTSVHKSPAVEDGSSTRGGLASRIPKPRTRSSIPMRASRNHMGSQEESWKDGCY